MLVLSHKIYKLKNNTKTIYNTYYVIYKIQKNIYSPIISQILIIQIQSMLARVLMKRCILPWSGPLGGWRSIVSIPEVDRKRLQLGCKFTKYQKSVNSKYIIRKKHPFDHNTLRSGVIGYKQGMTGIYDMWGTYYPCTVILMDRVQVIQVKEKQKDGVDALVLGAGERSMTAIKKPELGRCIKAGVPPKRDIREFPISPEMKLPVGYMITPRHFLPGQHVDVIGKSKGKGFAGGMKRWNFKGQRASHGNSRAHRTIGSIGQRTFPGKVFKGKKMPGRLGGISNTCYSRKVCRIDCKRSLLYLLGSVPGPTGSCVVLRDGFLTKVKEYLKLPFPTFLPAKGEVNHHIYNMPFPDMDPSEIFRDDFFIRIKHDFGDQDDEELDIDPTGTVLIPGEFDSDDMGSDEEGGAAAAGGEGAAAAGGEGAAAGAEGKTPAPGKEEEGDLEDLEDDEELAETELEQLAELEAKYGDLLREDEEKEEEVEEEEELVSDEFLAQRSKFLKEKTEVDIEELRKELTLLMPNIFTDDKQLKAVKRDKNDKKSKSLNKKKKNEGNAIEQYFTQFRKHYLCI